MYFKDFILQIKSFGPHKGCTYDCLHEILSPQLSLIPSPWFLLPYSSIISSYFWLQFIIPEVSILMKIVGFWYTLRYKTTGSCLFCHLVKKKQKINKKQQQQKTPQQQEGWSWWKWRWEHQDSSLWTPSPWTPAQCLFIQLEIPTSFKKCLLLFWFI